jgi:hypothetical protein
MITNSYSHFADVYHHTQGTSVQRIVDGKSTLWKGTHTKFEEEQSSLSDADKLWREAEEQFKILEAELEKIEPVRKWHCAACLGQKKVSVMRGIFNECLQKKVCYVGFNSIEPLEDQSRWNLQLKPFINKAREGDIIYLYDNDTRKVTHYGKYTGEYPKKLRRTPEWSIWEGKKCERLDYQISVDKWRKITPFEGAGIQKTIYEVTGHSNYE